jgi:hypothetical protein
MKTLKKEAVTKVATAVLSTTAKVKAREKKKAAAEGDAMETVRLFMSPSEFLADLQISMRSLRSRRKSMWRWNPKSHHDLRNTATSHLSMAQFQILQKTANPQSQTLSFYFRYPIFQLGTTFTQSIFCPLSM